MKLKNPYNFGMSIYNNASLENYLIQLEKFERHSKKIFFNSMANKLNEITNGEKNKCTQQKQQQQEQH